MKPFGKDLYRALVIGFLIGCAGMALGATDLAVHARTATPAPFALPGR